MKTLPVEASDEEILEAVRQWVGLLIEERYEEAFDFVVDREHNPWHWTPELLKKAIRSYGFSDKQEIYTVTPLAEAVGDRKPIHDVQRHSYDEHKGYVWFDLPLNGQWGDLTAMITFREIDRRLALELESIQVM